VLILTVALNREDANKTVHVVVETVENAVADLAMSQAEWERFVDRTAGAITDPTFVRHPQGEYEERDELS
jgi:hypothetical protein